jgi:hypothetical protein
VEHPHRWVVAINNNNHNNNSFGGAVLVLVLLLVLLVNGPHNRHLNSPIHGTLEEKGCLVNNNNNNNNRHTITSRLSVTIRYSSNNNININTTINNNNSNNNNSSLAACMLLQLQQLLLPQIINIPFHLRGFFRDMKETDRRLIPPEPKQHDGPTTALPSLYTRMDHPVMSIQTEKQIDIPRIP